MISIDEIEHGYVRILKEKKRVIDHCICIKDGVLKFFNFNNKNEVDENLVLMQKYISEHNIDQYFHISEAWDKVEVLVIEKFNRNLSTETIIHRFERTESNEIVLRERNSSKDNNNSSSRFNVYLEFGSHDEKTRNLIKKFKNKGNFMMEDKK